MLSLSDNIQESYFDDSRACNNFSKPGQTNHKNVLKILRTFVGLKKFLSDMSIDPADFSVIMRIYDIYFT